MLFRIHYQKTHTKRSATGGVSFRRRDIARNAAMISPPARRNAMGRPGPTFISIFGRLANRVPQALARLYLP